MALNQNQWTSSGPNGSTAWATSGANRTASLTYTLPQGSGQVSLTVSNYASTGPVWPTITSAATVTLTSGQTFSRTLQASTVPTPLFGNAIASAESYVSFVGAGTVDSWNSDPDNNTATPPVAYSFTAGNAANYTAVVAGKDNGTHGVVLTQATVRGYVATFGQPVSYATSGSPCGSVVGPSTPSAVKVDTARIGRSAFVPMDSVFTVGLPDTSGHNFGGAIQAVLVLLDNLTGGPSHLEIYRIEGDLTITGVPLLSPNLTVSRPFKLIIDGNLTISGGGQITVSGNGSLELYVAGDVTIGGNGIRNETGEPRKVALFCSNASTSDSLEFTTSQDFSGVVYCANKPIDIRENATFYGALLSRQWVRFSNNATAPVFHYDAALRRVRYASVTTPYLIDEVTQL